MHAYIHKNRNSEINWPLSDSTYTPDSMCIASFRSFSLSFFSSLSLCLCASFTHAVMGHDNTGRVHKKPEAIGENVANRERDSNEIWSVSLALHDVLLVLCGLADDLKGVKKREWLERGCLDRIQMIHMLHMNAGKTQKSDTP